MVVICSLPILDKIWQTGQEKGDTPALHAARHGNFQHLELLIAANADIEARNNVISRSVFLLLCFHIIVEVLNDLFAFCRVVRLLYSLPHRAALYNVWRCC